MENKLLEQRIQAHFKASITSLEQAMAQLSPIVAHASTAMAETIKTGGKIMACGNGGSAADAQHFSAELLNRFERERPALPGISLTTDTSTLTSIANDYSYEEVFSKQINALGKPGDILLVISTSGNSPSITQAVNAAHKKDVRCIALNGRNGGKLTEVLSGNDLNICVPGNVTARIQEVHGLIIHCFCDLIDHILYTE